MTDKRLKEIKDSIDLQFLIEKQLNVDSELLMEEKELYEYVEELKKQLNELQRPQIFIDTQDMEERYGEELYQDYLEKQVKELKKQLEEANKKLYLCTPEIPQNVHGEYVSYVDLVNEIYELKKQQQEFIKYLEDEIILYKNRSVYIVTDIHGSYDLNQIELEFFEEAVKKYKEIIGNDTNFGSKGENKDE